MCRRTKPSVHPSFVLTPEPHQGFQIRIRVETHWKQPRPPREVLDVIRRALRGNSEAGDSRAIKPPIGKPCDGEVLRHFSMPEVSLLSATVHSAKQLMNLPPVRTHPSRHFRCLSQHRD